MQDNTESLICLCWWSVIVHSVWSFIDHPWVEISTKSTLICFSDWARSYIRSKVGRVHPRKKSWSGTSRSTPIRSTTSHRRRRKNWRSRLDWPRSMRRGNRSSSTWPLIRTRVTTNSGATWSPYDNLQIWWLCNFVGLGSSVGWAPAGLTYVFAKGVSDQVRDPLTPRNSLQ